MSKAELQTLTCIPATDYKSHTSVLLSIATGLALGFGGIQAARLDAKLEESKSDDLPESPAAQQGWHLLDQDKRRAIFYKYERRIRDFSQPDKVFAYMASKKLPDGSRVMLPSDLLRAVVAVYPADGSTDMRSGALHGESSKPVATPDRQKFDRDEQAREFLSIFDADGNGISFSEYLLLLTFLKIPVQDAKVVFEMFDLNGDGSIHLKEFEDITAALQQRLRHVSKVMRTRSSTSDRDDSIGLKQAFFGEKGDKGLDLQRFDNFMKGLHEEILRLEFEHYDHADKGSISGLDFARSILSSVDMAQVDHYMARAAALPSSLADWRVSYEDFRHWAQLYQHIHKLSVALDFFNNVQGKLSKEDFKRASRIVSGKELPQQMVDITYELFDINKDGNLSATELIAVLRRREGSRRDRMSEDTNRSQSLFDCLYDCCFADR